LWKLSAARPKLEALAIDDKAPAPVRETAIAALAELGGAESVDKLTSLTAEDQASAIRARAVAGLASLDADKGAAAAVAVLPGLRPEDALIVFDAFLHKSGGPKALATALGGRKLPAEIAAVGINEASTLGERAKVLADALTAAGGTVTTRANLPPGQW